MGKWTPNAPRAAFAIDEDNGELLGLHWFVERGCTPDGIKKFYKCDEHGNHIDVSEWYSFRRIGEGTYAVLDGKINLYRRSK